MEMWSVKVRGSSICVPASPSCLTTYVLLEQEDWFEKEIAFVRRATEPGMRALDVGANFGVYTAALARGTGPSGRVWALEPASTTCEYLRKTIAINDFRHVHVVRLALSNRADFANLGIDRNSELNSLSVKAGQPTEEVPIATLDGFAAASGLNGLDFLKLDAEGEELRILDGGEHFLRSESPLVMFEVKAGAQWQLGLPRRFRELGYDIYRLVGPDRLLVPHAVADTLDPFELNLFACKADRASQLASRGLLARAYLPGATSSPGAGLSLCAAQTFGPALPPPQQVASIHAEALDDYALWRDETAGPELRATALRGALANICTAAREAPSNAVLSSAVRIAHEAGARGLAVQLLQALLGRLEHDGGPEHLCWPAHPRYDGVAVVNDARSWLLAAAVEAYVTSAAFSGYYTGDSCSQMLVWLQGTPYASSPMERRRQLITLLARQQAQPPPAKPR